MSEQPRYKLGDKIQTGSFQAQLFQVADEPFVAKVYGIEAVYDGVIPLNDHNFRENLILREASLVSALSPFAVALVSPVILVDREITAIILTQVSQDSFLDRRLPNSNGPPISVWQEMGIQVADFHFNPDLCPPLEHVEPTSFLKSLMAKEAKLLKQFHSDEASFIDSGEELIDSYINSNSNIFARRHALLGEPRLCHGDLELDNIAWEEGKFYIFDPAPIEEWQINSPRMDIAFLTVELEVLGYHEEAQCLTEAYNNRYLEHLRNSGMSEDGLEEVKESNKVMDRFARIYRLTNYYRLFHPKLKNNPEGMVRARELLVEDYRQLATGLGRRYL